jgi:hypothetical protein
MSFVCGGSMRGERLPFIPLTGLSRPHYLAWSTFNDFAGTICRFSVSSV